LSISEYSFNGTETSFRLVKIRAFSSPHRQLQYPALYPYSLDKFVIPLDNVTENMLCPKQADAHDIHTLNFFLLLDVVL
jgi:hypothetical protein